MFNYTRVAIDKVTSYLMQGFRTVCTPGDSSAGARERARRAEAVLYDVYDRNYLAQLDYETEVDCAILGDGCYKVFWDVAEKRIFLQAARNEVAAFQLIVERTGKAPLTAVRVEIGELEGTTSPRPRVA